MQKAAAIKLTETTKETKVREAKRAFLLGLVDLSWKLAGAFLLPTLIGVALDSGKDRQTFTIIGLIVGFIMSFLVILQIALRGNR
jgi:F0F1-type ATP synthase assembly protein I